MKVKLGQIVDAMPAIAEFAKERLPAKAAYRAAKLIRKMNSAHRDFFVARDTIVRRFGEPVEGKPNQYNITGEKRDEAEAEIQKLLQEEVELEGCAPIAWADVDGLRLAPGVLTDLDPFIEAPAD